MSSIGEERRWSSCCVVDNSRRYFLDDVGREAGIRGLTTQRHMKKKSTRVWGINDARSDEYDWKAERRKSRSGCCCCGCPRLVGMSFVGIVVAIYRVSRIRSTWTFPLRAPGCGKDRKLGQHKVGGQTSRGALVAFFVQGVQGQITLSITGTLSNQRFHHDYFAFGRKVI